MALEFLQVADAVAREKDISKDSVLVAMEQAIGTAARRKYGMHLNIDAQIDRISGDVVLKKLIDVVETVMEPVSKDEYRVAQREQRDMEMKPALDSKGKPLAVNDIHMTLKEAQKSNPQAALGDVIAEDLPPMDFGRVAAQAAKQVIFQKVRDAEREKEFGAFEHAAGQLVSGTVKRTDGRGVTVDLTGAEGFIPRDELINRETYRTNDRVRAYVYKVQREVRGPQIFLSRTHPEFLRKLYHEEVPEIGNGVIEIMSVARDPGHRAKIAVKSHDHNLDPVGACVGVRGSRVQNITAELQGERIDIIEWKANPAEFLVEAIAPAEVSKVVLDEEEQRIAVVVPEDKLSVAIGRRGQNVRLASILTGWDIDIMTEQEEEERRTKEQAIVSNAFMAALDVDETVTQLLIAEGFSSVGELLMVSKEELAAIDGFDESIAEELQRRSAEALDAQKQEIADLKVAQDLLSLEGLKQDVLLAVAREGIKTRDDFAELATDELMELVPEGLLKEYQAEALIMEARKHWFEEEDASEEVA